MTSAMQRSMSYRKPVPEYVPSPPSSPLFESGRTIQADEKHLPPLPPNWREVVATRIVEAGSIDATSTAIAGWQEQKMAVDAEDADTAKYESQLHLLSVNIGGDQETLATPQSSQIFHPNVHRGRGLPTRYRPPTPPLRSQSKQSRRLPVTGDKTFEAATLYSQTNLSHYPASHASSRHYLHSMRVGPRTASLRPTASFRTEMTTMSMNTNLSMGWSHGLGGASERGMYSTPTLFMQKQNARADASENYSPSGVLCGRWSNWKSGMSSWTKRLRRVLGVSK